LSLPPLPLLLASWLCAILCCHLPCVSAGKEVEFARVGEEVEGVCRV
jgi:hypothetical protein